MLPILRSPNDVSLDLFVFRVEGVHNPSVDNKSSRLVLGEWLGWDTTVDQLSLGACVVGGVMAKSERAAAIFMRKSSILFQNEIEELNDDV